jgi:hypothetical protein
MKTSMENFRLLILATFLFSSNLLLADDPTGPSLSVTGGNPSPNPTWIGTLVSANASASYSDPTSTNSEFAITNHVWSWTSSYGACYPTNGDGSATWTNTFSSPGIYTNVITANVDFQGYICINGSGVTNGFEVSTNASVTNVVEVVSMTLSNVTFSGGKHPIYKDDGSGAYPSPEWLPTTNYPVCYTRNTTMTVQPQFIVNPSSYSGGILVKGISSGPQLPTGRGTSPTLISTGTFANHVDFLNPMTIDWQVSLDNGNTWYDAGTSANKVYVTLNDPTCPTLFHTVVWLACSKTGATDANTAVANTWSLFGGSGPANITTWNGKLLYYYKANCGWANSATDTTSLLASANTANAWAGHGQCGSFANLLIDSLAANGINSDFTTASPKSSPDGFIVKDWTTNGPVAYSGNYCYKLTLVTEADGSIGMVPTPTGMVYGDLTKLSTKTGQNTSPPSEEAFARHFIVKYPPGPPLGVGTYYDPSYGVTYTDATNFETVAVWGYFHGVSGLDNQVQPASGLGNMQFDH